MPEIDYRFLTEADLENTRRMYREFKRWFENLPLDDVRYPIYVTRGDFTVTIHWGDGTTARVAWEDAKHLGEMLIKESEKLRG